MAEEQMQHNNASRDGSARQSHSHQSDAYQSAQLPTLSWADFFSVLRDLVHDWWMILTAGLAAMMAAWLFLQMIYVPVYTSSATLIISAKSSTGGVVSDLTVSSTTAETLAEVLNSSLLKKYVMDDLGVSELPEIEASLITNTNLMTLQVTSESPESAFRVLRSILDNYDQVTSHILSNVVLGELESPTVPTSPSNSLSARTTLTYALWVGMGAMALLLGALSVRRDAVKTEKEVSKKLDTKLFMTVYHENKYKTLGSRLRRSKSALLSTSSTSFLFAETYKKLRTRLMYQSEKSGAKVLLVTSVAENEGKSTVAANIALALAQKMDRVVLIDGDLRRPAIYKLFSKPVPPSSELSSFLSGDIPVDDLLLQDRDSGLNLVLGSKNCTNSTELVAGEVMRGLVEALRYRSNYVVIDSPPMAIMADAEVLAEYADVSLLVVRQNMTYAPQINDAIDSLEASHAKLLGCVFNDVKTRIFSGSRTWRYGYGYGYGYGRYNRGYGAYYGKQEEKK
ncbi:MAG: polysaccharide biosynthesis tyrosine autokinase [Clostridiales bacterium]|nr:polysaccharide biosynthesis tyrosine autokinase [Clostridiales bacterium]